MYRPVLDCEAMGFDVARVDLNGVPAVIDPAYAEAAAMALRYFRTPLAADDKGGRLGWDPVTEADRGIESLLRERIGAAYPDHQIIGEEWGTTGDDPSVRWIIDPIDGTKAFVTGVPAWGILLGLVVDDVAVGGWACQPYLDETYFAVGASSGMRHAGVTVPLRTSGVTDLSQATMYTTHPSMFIDESDWARFSRLAGGVRMQRYGGDCMSYCLLALGHIDLVVENHLQPYDIVPLIAIIEAAGGVITNGDGQSPLTGGLAIAAATPELHAAALALYLEEGSP
jgi:histidinol phosphatase-like enzyme (inositol monophosphatase family)